VTARAEIRVGIAGTGFVATRFVAAFDGRQGLRVTGVLTRRDPAGVRGFSRPELLTDAPGRLVECADVVLECSGDAVRAAAVVEVALAAGRPVVTMNPEFHVTAGSYFVGRGLVSECEGDQPGALAGLHAFAAEMGFRPLAYCNIKGFLNHDPTPDEMARWACRQRISLPMVTASTDGTKLQVEQALVANFLGADIARPGLLGPEDADFRRAGAGLAEVARRLGRPIADYVLCPGGPHGVFLVAEHEVAGRDPDQAAALEYFKLGPGPFYTILRPNIFVHLELPRAIRRIVERGEALMDNSASPTVTVVPLAKRALVAGTYVERGIGSFDFRGVCVRIADRPGSLPIGLLQRAVLRRAVEPGELLAFDDVEIEDSLAARAWLEVERRTLVTSAA
jgi:predicted homoserine dehydrogenase-like protein